MFLAELRSGRARLPAALTLAITLAIPAGAKSADIESTSVIPIGKAAGQAHGHVFQVDVLRSGDSSRKQREEAISQLPLNRLSPAAQIQARKVLKDLSLFRRLPTLQIDADRRAYEYFCHHPDVAVSIWRAMGISRVQLWQVGEWQYETDTRDGTIGTVDILLSSPSSYIVLCQGKFQSPALPRPIQAMALMHLQPRFTEEGKVTHHVDLFVSLPSQTVETIAKLVSPVSNRVADRNFEEVSLFIEMMSLGMGRQPGWVEQLANKLEGVLPERPQQLKDVTAAIYVDAEKKRLAESGLPVSLEAILPPVVTPATATAAPQSTLR